MNEDNISESDSFENISLLDESIAPLDYLASENFNIKPCLLTAKDILTSSNVHEIEHFSSLEMANKVLSTLVESESKIYRALSKNADKSSVEHSYSFGFQPGSLSSPNKQSSLPSISLSKLSPSILYLHITLNNLLKIGGFSQNPKQLINSTFKHPLEDPVSFNSSLSELAHLSQIVSRLLNINLNYDIIPYPFQIVMLPKSFQENKYKENEKIIICFESNSSVKQLKGNVKNVKIFLESLTSLIIESAKICKKNPIKIDLNAMDLMLNVDKLSKLDSSMWESAIQSLINIGRLFIDTIEKISSQNLEKFNSMPIYDSNI